MTSPRKNALHILTRWRTVFASWQLGTRADTDAECQAVKDHREATLLLRAEVSALTALLIQSGVIKGSQFVHQLNVEADIIDKMLEKRFPGFRAVDDGMVIDLAQAMETMKKWPS